MPPACRQTGQAGVLPAWLPLAAYTIGQYIKLHLKNLKQTFPLCYVQTDGKNSTKFLLCQ